MFFFNFREQKILVKGFSAKVVHSQGRMSPLPPPALLVLLNLPKRYWHFTHRHCSYLQTLTCKKPHSLLLKLWEATTCDKAEMDRAESPHRKVPLSEQEVGASPSDGSSIQG